MQRTYLLLQKYMKALFWKLVYYSCFLSYPFIVFYCHYLRPSMNRVLGLYSSRNFGNKGKDLRVKGFGTFTSPHNIVVGDYCRIGNNAYFHAYGGLVIGNNVQISRNVVIYTANHNFHSNEFLPYDNTEIPGKVVIRDNVWIGMNVSVLPNVEIGQNAIVGMGAVISKSVPENAIVVGFNRIVGYRNHTEATKMFGKEFPDA